MDSVRRASGSLTRSLGPRDIEREPIGQQGSQAACLFGIEVFGTRFGSEGRAGQLSRNRQGGFSYTAG